MQYKTKNLKAKKINITPQAIKLEVSDKIAVSNLKFVQVFSLYTSLKAFLKLSELEAYKKLLENNTTELIRTLLDSKTFIWRGVITRDGYLLKVKSKAIHLINKLDYCYLIDGLMIYEVLDIDFPELLKKFIDYEFDFGDW